ncbi:hypothetical protein [Actinocrinis sp.]|uniref:hypothetical protein n=1 Tax=Actinocrinis sp. TaxID=1920516 RepID=UPI002D3C5FE7|nr:hypothetical protein [Actinocrinis sp.]HZP54585.1 hypothetical protein [Actinocrinis sp.]
MKPIKLNKRIGRRALLLAAVPLTAVLAGGVAIAATSGGNPPTPAGTATTQQDRDRARDGSCLNSPAAAPSATVTQPQDRDQIRERARDGSCLDSPSAVPGTTMQNMYEHRYQHGDETDR